MEAQFDPSNIRQLFEQDDAMAASVAYKGPGISKIAIRRMTDEELAGFLKALREAVHLPLSYRFVAGMRAVLTYAEQTQVERSLVKARQEAAIRRAKANGTYQAWEQADLVAEVQAISGEGRRMGKEWWFSCPKHSDSTPSLHVNAEKRTWHCFGCQRGGGVVEWRRLIR